MSEYVTIPCAYQQTGVSEALIRSAIQSGQVRAWTCAGETVVTLKDVIRYRTELIAGRGCESCD